MKQKTNTLLQQIGKYFISGGVFFWSGYAMFALLYSGLGAEIGVSKVLSYIFGLSVNFLLLRWWVFRTKRPVDHLPEVSLEYGLLSVINLGIDYVIVVGLANIGLTPYIGQFVSAGFFTVWNFLWYRLWIFAPHHASKKQSSQASK